MGRTSPCPGDVLGQGRTPPPRPHFTRLQRGKGPSRQGEREKQQQKKKREPPPPRAPRHCFGHCKLDFLKRKCFTGHKLPEKKGGGGRKGEREKIVQFSVAGKPGRRGQGSTGGARLAVPAPLGARVRLCLLLLLPLFAFIFGFGFLWKRREGEKEGSLAGAGQRGAS